MMEKPKEGMFWNITDEFGNPISHVTWIDREKKLIVRYSDIVDGKVQSLKPERRYCEFLVIE